MLPARCDQASVISHAYNGIKKKSLDALPIQGFNTLTFKSNLK